MFNFLKKIFGWDPKCTDCEDINPNEPTFPIEEVSEESKVVETAPVENEQPSLKMNMPTATNPTVDTPEVVETPEQNVEAPVAETPTVAEVTADTTDETTAA